MNSLIYIGIFVILIGIFLCCLALWAVLTHREKKYKYIQEEHLKQANRVKNKIKNEVDKNNEN